MKKKNRVGEIRISNEGYKMKIVKYNGWNDILIEFQDEYKAKVNVQYCNFENGRVKNPYYPIVYNYGFLGQGIYNAKEHKKIYKVWNSMLQRCYDPYYLNRQPTYINCFVCEEWHNFQNFAKWYEENYYEIKNEIMYLDKDILFKGNKIYSPDTCIFVPRLINNLFAKRQNDRGKYPIGVCCNKATNKLRCQCNVFNKKKNNIVRVHLGSFPIDKPFQAFTCYKNFKENYIKQVADEYKDLIPTKLYNALYNYQVEIND